LNLFPMAAPRNSNCGAQRRRPIKTYSGNLF
jgi:hypothetical protein